MDLGGIVDKLSVRWGGRARATACLLIAVLVAVVVGMATVVAVNLARIEQAAHWDRHTALVERATAQALRFAVDQQTGIRGYSETRDAAFLAPYQTGRVGFSRSLEELTSLTRDNPAQATRVARLSVAMTQWQNRYAVPQLKRLEGGGGVDAAVKMARLGKSYMDEVRVIVSEINAEESGLTIVRSQDRERAFLMARVTLALACAAAIVVGVILGYVALRSLVAAEQAALRSANSKSQALSVASHEIRTPLNGMLGMAEAMSADNLSLAQRERLEVLRESGDALVTLLNDLLDASKIEAGRLELVEQPFDLTRLLRRIHATFEPGGVRKGLAVHLTISPEAEGRWIGDQARIGQICANLISNAVKFTKSGRVALDVALSPQGALVIQVIDTGIGMSPDVVANLFTPFGQADATIAHRYGGSGLGLAISRDLARLMKGEVTVGSVVGEGSTFTLSVPLERAEDEPAALNLASPASLSGLSVLAADDNAVNRRILATILSSFGVSVTLVEDGAEAVAAFGNQRFDAVLMDLRMPNCDGFEATRQIRLFEESTHKAAVPIILLSGDVSSEVQTVGRALGIDAFVAKPLEVNTLIGVLTQTIRAVAIPQARAA